MKTSNEITEAFDGGNLSRTDIEQLITERDYFINLSVDLRFALLDALKLLSPGLEPEQYVSLLSRALNTAASHPSSDRLWDWTLRGNIVDGKFVGPTYNHDTENTES